MSADHTEKEDVSAETTGALSSYKDLGEIPGTGEGRTSKYSNPPRYSAYTFYADKGDEVDVWVKGAKGGDDDAVVWVLDAKDKTIGTNDDADGTTRDAHVVVTAPSTGPKAKYRIVFRDYYLAKATFTVSVRVKPGLTKCAVDADCVKTKSGCCGLTFTAVNASRVDDVACKPPYPPCAPPPPMPDDLRVAQCNAGTCALVEPTAIACGGFTTNPHACPAGYVCKKDGVPMDVPGKCVAGCDESKEPNRKYVAHSPEQCKLVRYACEPGTVGFSNDCGCGCEQPSDCPTFINCMPGPGDTATTCATLRAKCPYTPVAF